jgi:hypothetical protein
MQERNGSLTSGKFYPQLNRYMGAQEDVFVCTALIMTRTLRYQPCSVEILNQEDYKAMSSILTHQLDSGLTQSDRYFPMQMWSVRILALVG